MAHCHRCETELAHCHGTLVRHDDGAWECTADQAASPGTGSGAGAGRCTGDVVAHDFVLRCSDQWAGCCGEPAASAGAEREWALSA